MTQYFTESELEARQMMEEFRDKHEWDPLRQAMLIVWRAEWSSSLRIDQINAIATVLCNYSKPVDLQKVCTHAVRNGLLRTRMIRGKRNYELKLK